MKSTQELEFDNLCLIDRRLIGTPASFFFLFRKTSRTRCRDLANISRYMLWRRFKVFKPKLKLISKPTCVTVPGTFLFNDIYDFFVDFYQ